MTQSPADTAPRILHVPPHPQTWPRDRPAHAVAMVTDSASVLRCVRRAVAVGVDLLRLAARRSTSDGELHRPLRWATLLRWLWSNHAAPGSSIEELQRAHALARHHAQELVDLEPGLAGVVRSLDVREMQFLTGRRQDRAAQAWRRLSKLVQHAPRRILVVPSLSSDVMVYIAPIVQLAIELHAPHNLLIVAAEEAAEGTHLPHALADRVDWLVLARHAADLDETDRVEILVFFLRALKPETVLYVGGPVACSLLRQHGRALAVVSDMHLLLTALCGDAFDLLGDEPGGQLAMLLQVAQAVLVATPLQAERMLRGGASVVNQVAKVRVVGVPSDEQWAQPMHPWPAMREAVLRAPSFLGHRSPRESCFGAPVPSAPPGAAARREQREMQMDVTVVLNAHRESELACASVDSLLRCQALAQGLGIQTEVIVVLDHSDEATRSFFAAHAPASWRIEHTGYADLGLARNHAVERAAGKFVAFLDADDLFGGDWLVLAWRAARADARCVVWHPEINVYFGASQRIFLHADMDDRRFDLMDLVSVNQWTALAFAPIGLLRNVPYRPIDLVNQIGYEDWSWNEAVIAAGAIHKIVPGAAHFVRVKANASLVSKSIAARSVAWPGGLLSAMLSGRPS